MLISRKTTRYPFFSFFLFFWGGDGGSLMMMTHSAKPIQKSILVDKIMNKFRFFLVKIQASCFIWNTLDEEIMYFLFASSKVDKYLKNSFSCSGGGAGPQLFFLPRPHSRRWQPSCNNLILRKHICNKKPKAETFKDKVKTCKQQMCVVKKTKRRPKIKKSRFKWAENSNLTPSPAPFLALFLIFNRFEQYCQITILTVNKCHKSSWQPLTPCKKCIKVWVSEKCSKKYSKKQTKNFTHSKKDSKK